MEDGSINLTVDARSRVCVACGNDRYRERGSLLNSRSSELFGFAWADQKATNFIRTKCGYIHWFLI